MDSYSVEFAPRSLRTGAVLPGSMIPALEARIDELAATKDRRDQWLTDAAPLLSRGDAWIVPLSWEPALVEGEVAERPDVRARVSALWLAIGVDCEYRHGNHIGVDLDPETGTSSYAAELRRTGARRADWWSIGNSGMAVVRVVYGEPVPAPMTRTAVHVVPRDWVWDASERVKLKQRVKTDLDWSWAEVIDLYANRNPS